MCIRDRNREFKEHRSAQGASGSVKPSPPVGPAKDFTGGASFQSPMERFRQAMKQAGEEAVNVIASPVEAAGRASSGGESKTLASKQKRDTTFDKTLRVLDKAMTMSDKEGTKKSIAVFWTVWDWFLSLAYTLSNERMLTLALSLWVAGPQLMPPARRAIVMLVKRMLCILAHRIMDGLVSMRAKVTQSALAYLATYRPHTDGVLTAADGGVMPLSLIHI